MLVKELETYESWDLTLPALPKRSHLYSLQPIGMATCYQESLTSYISRLAQAHGVSVATLIRYKLALFFILRNQPANLSKVDAFESAFSIWRNQPLLLHNGTAEYWLDGTRQVEKVVEVLEMLTQRQELRHMTVLPWQRLFWLKNLFGFQQLWCPACYQEWRDTESALYEPLLWAFEVVEVCPRHQRYLQTWCLYCGCSQPFLKLNAKPGYCSECGAWLGRWVEPLPQPRPKEERWDWYLWVAQAVGQLLALMPLLNQVHIDFASQSSLHQPKLKLTAFLKQCYKMKVSPVDRLRMLIPTNLADSAAWF